MKRYDEFHLDKPDDLASFTNYLKVLETLRKKEWMFQS